MSAKLFKTDIRFLQRILAVSGFYTKALNRKWNADVEAAEQAFLARCEEIKGKLGQFDARIESNIATLIPQAQIKARELMNAVKGQS